MKTAHDVTLTSSSNSKLVCTNTHTNTQTHIATTRNHTQAEKKVVATVPDDDDGPIDASAFWETSASVVGAGAKRTELTKPQHGRVAVTKEFYDRGHLHT